MKKIILLYSVLTLSISVFPQDTLYLKGCYLQRYDKKEILFKKQNEDLKLRSKSYKTMIDYKMQPFFFTLKINSNITLMKEDEIASIFCSSQNYHNVEIFQFPPFNNQAKKFIDSLNIHVPRISFKTDSNYYMIKKDTLHLYKIYYIEGYALRIKLDNDYLNPRAFITLATEWNIAPIVNRNIPSFYIYLFYNYKIASSTKLPQGFIKWRSDKYRQLQQSR
jgi:hypothetical protein